MNHSTHHLRHTVPGTRNHEIGKHGIRISYHGKEDSRGGVESPPGPLAASGLLPVSPKSLPFFKLHL